MVSVGDILTYSGSSLDMAINYVLLLLTTAALALAAAERPRKRPYWVGVWIFLFAFQIALCLAEGCTGVSVVWCALWGYALAEARRERDWEPSERLRALRLGQCVPCTAALVYYAVVEEPLTTVAHGCALALGWLLEWAVARWCPFLDSGPSRGVERPLVRERRPS